MHFGCLFVSIFFFLVVRSSIHGCTSPFRRPFKNLRHFVIFDSERIYVCVCLGWIACSVIVYA